MPPTKTVTLTNPACTYEFLTYHRGNPTANKSVWNITENEEVDCFIGAFKDGDLGWGLHYSVEYSEQSEKKVRLLYLGSNFHQEQLFIAKFIGNNGSWHGYPADYIRKNKGDKPAATVLKNWRDQEVITKAQMSKINQGKPCNL